jgi:Holliday junction resolvase RusA-like endonuclease
VIPLLIEAAVEPMPMPRASRDPKGRTFLSPAYRAYRDALSWEMLHARNAANVLTPLEVPVELMLTFVRSSNKRVDGDNLEKAVLDAGTGVLWLDDSQVFRCCWEKVLGAPVPGTTIRVQAMEGV